MLRFLRKGPNNTSIYDGYLRLVLASLGISSILMSIYTYVSIYNIEPTGRWIVVSLLWIVTGIVALLPNFVDYKVMNAIDELLNKWYSMSESDEPKKSKESNDPIRTLEDMIKELLDYVDTWRR